MINPPTIKRARRALAVIGLALISPSLALVLETPAAADFRQLASPGPLANPHAALESNCDACHVPFKGIPSSACLACHQKTAARIKSGQGTHFLYEQKGQKCSACHNDHKGKTHSLIPEIPPDFDHKVTGFNIEGAHKQVACAQCHTQGPTGMKFTDLPHDCAGCHKEKDPHKGALGEKCQACHSVNGFKPATKTLADHKMVMTGKHANLKCENCHAKGAHLFRPAPLANPATATAMALAQAATGTHSCGECHEQKHGGTRSPCSTCHSPDNPAGWKGASFKHDFCTCILPGKHQTAPCLGCHPAYKFTPTPFACAACHNKDRKHEELGACSRCHSALSFQTKVFDHNGERVGFKIEGKHLEVGCENCHTKKGVFKGAPTACAGCHKTPLHGDFGDCAKCHTVAGFEKPSFSHDKTRFPLDGVHATVDCQSCHSKLKPGQFQPGPNACLQCHPDPHRAQFDPKGDSKKSREMPAQNGLHKLGTLLASNVFMHSVSPERGCLDCHTTKTWTPSTIDVGRHQSLAFPLKGAHQNVACARCHDFGVFAGTPTDCKSCHLDRHQGRFGNDCARCHNEDSFKEHPGFDHGKETGFLLENAHAAAPCASCHGSDGQKLAGVKDIGCATCHSPNHGKQFGADCASCHKTTKFSAVPAFDHSQTLFPLERRHAALPCTTCHDTRVRERVIPECRACHGDPHRGRASLDCAECHRADSWNIIRYDHDRSEFPLRGRHFVTACNDCHTNNVFTGLRTECISCHRADKRTADMMVSGHQMNGFSCGDCHKPFKW